MSKPTAVILAMLRLRLQKICAAYAPPCSTGGSGAAPANVEAPAATRPSAVELKYTPAPPADRACGISSSVSSISAPPAAAAAAAATTASGPTGAGGTPTFPQVPFNSSTERTPAALAVTPGGLLRRGAPSRWRSGGASLGAASRRVGGDGLSGLFSLHGNGKILLVVLAYGTSSLSGVFVNKACLSAFRFSYTLALMLSQLLVSVSLLSLLRLTGAITIPHRSPRELLVLLLPTACFISNVCVGLLALRLVNIPMFSAFRRLSVLNVMVLEWLVLGKTVTRKVMVTVVIMVAGSFLAGIGDLTYDPLGYALVFLNNFVTGANLVSIKKASQVVRLDALSLFYYISLLALPVVALTAAATGELSASLEAVATRPELRTSSFAFALSLSAASAFLVNFFTNLCTQMTTPLTTAITGQMKNVLQTLLGIFAWGYQVSFTNLMGLAVALFGSLLFAYYKFESSGGGRPAGGEGNRGGADGKADYAERDTGSDAEDNGASGASTAVVLGGLNSTSGGADRSPLLSARAAPGERLGSAGATTVDPGGSVGRSGRTSGAPLDADGRAEVRVPLLSLATGGLPRGGAP
eukprot:TRINITY_DN592_c0_g1_i1.p1 TRINITY_DN592_c0_g1~~TRINITY_DN592_c0_g1_i1.p1  ORF type:complete len:581 (-),score=187.04 TRINITY_DN592_c0_g1_i1:427-2169(-)